MPTLADIYSAIDSAKRKGSDFVRNPGASLQQMVGLANDRAGALNELTSQAAMEGGKYGPKSQQLANQMAEAYNPIGMTVKTPVFEITKMDASQIFGKGAERVKYTDPHSKGTIEVLVRPDGTASVLGLEVPEKFRGLGIGQSLQAKAMQDFTEMQGQVSSKAAATTAYKLGRRPPFQPHATLNDVFKLMDENSSVNLVSPKMQTLFQQEQ
ncbi:MAG: hypothetical protein RLZZ152_2122 [Pseudomonadota bacterium]